MPPLPSTTPGELAVRRPASHRGRPHVDVDVGKRIARSAPACLHAHRHARAPEHAKRKTFCAAFPSLPPLLHHAGSLTASRHAGMPACAGGFGFRLCGGRLSAFEKPGGARTREGPKKVRNVRNRTCVERRCSLSFSSWHRNAAPPHPSSHTLTHHPLFAPLLSKPVLSHRCTHTQAQ